MNEPRIPCQHPACILTFPNEDSASGHFERTHAREVDDRAVSRGYDDDPHLEQEDVYREITT